jgi:cell wall-associated NlpC family hydrolase
MTSARSTASRPATSLLLVLTLVLGLLGGAATVGAAPAQAAVSATVANRVLSFAASRRGAPYKYGAAGPTRFDCSGLTKWAYARAGKTLPRTAAQQYGATIRVSRANARRGDLIFFMSGGRPYHMGVYAGSGKLWHAPKTGDVVKLSTIWSSAVTFGRVR